MTYYEAIEQFHQDMSNATNRKQRVAAGVKLADAIADQERACDIFEAWMEQHNADLREMNA